MKLQFKNIPTFSALLLGVLLSACTKEDAVINTNVGAVKTLFAPDNGKYVKLDPTGGASVQFEWEQAHAEDGGLVQYEVAFDSAGGDFSQPVYTISSDDNGVQNSLSLSHKDLNKIASMAGIEPLSMGTLRWTVFSVKGINSVKADTVRTLTVERPAGFTDIPSDVYLTGDATEGGADLSKAIRMKAVAPGVFEVFTKLKAGSYYFTDKATAGTPATYSIAGALIKGGGTNTQADEKIYRIRLDFNNAAAEMTEIESVGLYVAAKADVTATLSYAGNGIWSAQNVPIEFVQFSWGRDDRYKFRLTTKDAAGNESFAFYGSTNQTNSVPPTASTPAAYYDVVPVDNSQWDYTYKFPTAADGKNVNITLDLSPADTYTQKIEVQ